MVYKGILEVVWGGCHFAFCEFGFLVILESEVAPCLNNLGLGLLLLVPLADKGVYDGSDADQDVFLLHTSRSRGIFSSYQQINHCMR